MLHSEITDKILKAFFTVNNTLGFGFLEKVYENAISVPISLISKIWGLFL